MFWRDGWQISVSRVCRGFFGTVALHTPDTEFKTSALTHYWFDSGYMRVGVEVHAEGNIEPYFNQMWFTVFLVLMMIVHGPYFKVNSCREGAFARS